MRHTKNNHNKNAKADGGGSAPESTGRVYELRVTARLAADGNGRVPAEATLRLGEDETGTTDDAGNVLRLGD